MNEIWKDIEGYENLYQVSDLGRIKSLPKTVILFHGGSYKTKEKILNLRMSDGYLFVALFDKGKRIDIQVHILVGRAFVPNPSNKKEINHKRGIKWDNRATELEWCTHQENVQHGYDFGLYDGRSKSVQCLCTGRIMKVAEAAKELSLSKTNLWAMLRGVKNNWSHFIYC